MTPVKKLADILQDALSTMAGFEHRYRDVCARFVCYRNGQTVHQSGTCSRHQLLTELPHVCRSVGATKVCLTITGTDQQLKGGAIQLYNETFRLARTSHSDAGSAPGGYGLGSPSTQAPIGMSGMSHSGLGAAETAALVNKVVADKLLRQAHSELQTNAEQMRQKIKGLERELEAQAEVNNSRNMVKEYTEMIAPFVPAITSLLGIEKSSGKSLLGLGSAEGTTSGANVGSEAQEEDAQTKMVMGLVRQFMKGLGDTHRQQLLSVMMRIQQDHNLITRIAQFTQRPTPRHQATTLKPEQSQDEQQHQQ